ncbi:hypothetical protein JT193_04965 [Helicobacter pylori]|nr:hypothetical protein [Helicobacter pylori]
MLRKNILAYYGANFLLIIAQSLPHAILTPLLLSKGLSLSEILLVQTFFSFCVLVAEYPSRFSGFDEPEEFIPGF